MVPMRNGKLSREEPRRWLPKSTADCAAVATKPQSMTWMMTSPASVTVVPLRGLVRVQRHGGGDHADVRERLRKVADGLAARRLDLLGEQVDVVGAAEQPLEQRLGLLPAPAVGEILGGPEAARCEHVL